jgi:hypothetical protein
MIAWREDLSVVIPAEAGIHGSSVLPPRPAWMPACAGMTEMRIDVWVAG